MADIFNDADVLKMTSDVVKKLENNQYDITNDEKNILLNKINDILRLHMKLNL